MAVQMEIGEDYPEIRESVAKLCQPFVGEYWRKLDDGRAYPQEFVAALTEAGYLAALIPERYGGAQLPLLARTTSLDDVKKRSDGLSVFLIDLRDARAHGCRVTRLEAMVNHNTTEVFFDNVPVPASGLIGQEGHGFRYILDGMNAERILV